MSSKPKPFFSWMGGKTDFITNLYKGYNSKEFDVKSCINNGKTSNKEVIITNY